MSTYAIACRECAIGLLNTARDVKLEGNTSEVVRLVNTARWYWRRFTHELTKGRN